MKNTLFIITILALVACSNQHNKIVDIDTPEQIEAGFVQVLPDQHYYIDSSSIWIDNHHNELINFDMVTNLSEAQGGFKQYPGEMSKSIRSHKKINCKTNTYSRAGEVVYSEFWGKGIDLRQSRQLSRTTHIKPDTTLDTVAKVLCANFYKP